MKKDFVNDKLFFKQKQKSSSINDQIKELNDNEMIDNLIIDIKNKFSFNDGSYIFEFDDEESNKYTIYYIESTNTINMAKMKNEDIIETWLLDFEFLSLQYNSLNNPKDSFIESNNIIECLKEKCTSSSEKEKEFWDVIHNALNSN